MTIRTMDFDRIASSAPLDARASVVRDGSGDLWDGPPIPPDRQHWKAPPLPLEGMRGGFSLPDLSGQVFGRLTVVRFHGYSGVSTPCAVWLVRCVCGDYEVRKHKVLMAGRDKVQCCIVCERVDNIRKRAAKPPTHKSRRASVAFLDRLAAQSRGAV